MSKKGLTPQEAKPLLAGVVNIMFTPFKSAAEIDEKAVRSNIRYMIEGGIVKGRGVQVIGGSIGEGYSLSDDEYKQLIEIAVEEADGEVPICVGCIRPTTEPVIRIAKLAEEGGADCVMVLAPHYVPDCPPDLVYAHYKALADATDIGIMIYDNPGVAGLDMPVDLLARLGEIDNIIALKEVTRDMFKMREVAYKLSERFTLNTATYRWMMPFDYQIGVHGFNTMFGNIDPSYPLQVHDAASKVDFERCHEIWTNTLPLYKYVYTQPAYVAIAWGKEMARIAGRPMGSYERLPLQRPGEEVRTKLREVMEKAGMAVSRSQ